VSTAWQQTCLGRKPAAAARSAACRPAAVSGRAWAKRRSGGLVVACRCGGGGAAQGAWCGAIGVLEGGGCVWGRGVAYLVEGAAEGDGQGEFGLGVGVAPLQALQVFLGGGQVVGGGGVLAEAETGVQAGAESVQGRRRVSMSEASVVRSWRSRSRGAR
jgi:hypothetical protein